MQNFESPCCCDNIQPDSHLNSEKFKRAFCLVEDEQFHSKVASERENGKPDKMKRFTLYRFAASRLGLHTQRSKLPECVESYIKKQFPN